MKNSNKIQITGVIIFCLIVLIPLALSCGGGGGGNSQAASGVTISNLAGTWNFTFFGTVGTNSSNCPQTSFGTFTLDTSGNIIGNEQVHSLCGDASLSFTGNASVNSIGTGTANITTSQQLNETLTLQVSNSQTEMFFSDITDTGIIVSGIAFKQ